MMSEAPARLALGAEILLSEEKVGIAKLILYPKTGPQAPLSLDGGLSDFLV